MYIYLKQYVSTFIYIFINIYIIPFLIEDTRIRITSRWNESLIIFQPLFLFPSYCLPC